MVWGRSLVAMEVGSGVGGWGGCIYFRKCKFFRVVVPKAEMKKHGRIVGVLYIIIILIAKLKSECKWQMILAKSLQTCSLKLSTAH